MGGLLSIYDLTLTLKKETRVQSLVRMNSVQTKIIQWTIFTFQGICHAHKLQFTK